MCAPSTNLRPLLGGAAGAGASACATAVPTAAEKAAAASVQKGAAAPFGPAACAYQAPAGWPASGARLAAAQAAAGHIDESPSAAPACQSGGRRFAVMRAWR